MEFGFEFKTIDKGKPLKSLFLESDIRGEQATKKREWKQENRRVRMIQTSSSAVRPS